MASTVLPPPTALDCPAVLTRLFYPRPATTPPADAGGQDLEVATPDGEQLAARFHPCAAAAPTLLFFHGNGEIVADYDDLAPLFVDAGVNFLPVDYRGYGRSSGRPSASRLLADAPVMWDFLRAWLRNAGYQGPLAVAGRSLGSAPALELAAGRAAEVAALLLDSAFADTLPLLRTLGVDVAGLGLSERDGFHNRAKIGSYPGPTLLIHGARDQLLPPANARTLLAASPASDKRLLLIEEADHNTVFAYGLERYLGALRQLLGLAGG